jgi:hypothetical protein
LGPVCLIRAGTIRIRKKRMKPQDKRLQPTTSVSDTMGLSANLSFRAYRKKAGTTVLLCIAVTLLLFRTAFAASLAPFVFVMIDSQTEAQYGGLPFNRSLVATVVKKLSAAKAKGIVLKFFYDLPSTAQNDRLLEESICAAPVALQGSLNDTEGTNEGLEPRFRVDALPFPDLSPLFNGEKALIPLKRFRRCARAVGFVDSTVTEIPLVEVYQGKLVKSLHLIALEMASDQKAEIDPSGFVRLGNTRLHLMHQIVFPTTNSLSYVPLHEVLNDKTTAWRAKVQQSVVILGYDGKNIHSIETPLGPLGAHRFFILGLLSLAKTF